MNKVNNKKYYNFPGYFGIIVIVCLIGLFTPVIKSSVSLTLVLGGGIAIWSMRYPKMLIIGLAAYIPLEEWLLKWIPYGAYEILRFGWEFLIFIILFLVLGQKIINEKKILKSPVDGMIFAFISIALISTLINPTSLLVGVLGLRTLLRYAVLYYLIINLNIDEKFVKKLMKVMVAIIILQWIASFLQRFIGGSVVSFFSPREVFSVGSIILGKASGIWEKGTWVFGTMKRYNHLGYFLTFFLLLFSGIYYTADKRNKKLFCFMLMSFLVLLLTYSRSAWLGLYIGLILLLYIRKKINVLFLLVLLPIILTLILYMTYAHQISFTGIHASKMSFIQRYLQMFSGAYLRSSFKTDRLAVLTKVSKETVLKSPLVGFGLGIVEYREVGEFGEGVQKSLEQIEVAPRIKHFIGDVGWSSILVQTGLIGLFIWLGICFVFLRVTLKLYRRSENNFYKGIALGYGGAIVAIMIENFFCYNFTYRPSSFYFWLFGGIVVNLWVQEKKKLNR